MSVSCTHESSTVLTTPNIPSHQKATLESSSKDAGMSPTLISSGKNEPNYRGKDMHAPEKTFTMHSLQPPGQQSEGPKTNSRKISPTLKDERKLFVGGLPPDITSDEFFNFFNKFGVIADSVVMFDRETRRPRGFGFVTYEDASVCDRLVQMGNEKSNSRDLNSMIGRMEMRGKIMEIKRAQPRAPAPPRPLMPLHMYHHYQMDPYFNPEAHGLYEQQEDGEYEVPQEYGSYEHQQQHASQNDFGTLESSSHPQHQYKNSGYSVPPTPPTPSPYYLPVNPNTPVTPQVAFDMAHHMVFYSQLLATPSLIHQHNGMVSPMMASPMMPYRHQPPQPYQNAFSSHPIPESVLESELDAPDLQPTLSPKPAATAPSIIVSPARKGKPFSIGGATFFPEAGGGGSRSPGLPPPLSPNMKHAKPGLPEKKREEVDMGGGPVTPL